MRAHPQAGQFADGAAGLEDDAVELQGLQPRQPAQVHGLAPVQAEVAQVQCGHLWAGGAAVSGHFPMPPAVKPTRLHAPRRHHDMMVCSSTGIDEQARMPVRTTDMTEGMGLRGGPAHPGEALAQLGEAAVLGRGRQCCGAAAHSIVPSAACPVQCLDVCGVRFSDNGYQDVMRHVAPIHLGGSMVAV